jgi:cellulose synthase/poly-beta-1,6-N-acetylglucosamine synthase-like glycosyltransferase
VLALARAFWASVALIVYTHLGYPVVLWVLARLQAEGGRRKAEGGEPSVSLVIAARDEGEVIGAKVRNALALDYPRERLEVIVCSDGSTDRTVEAAREAGADLVLDLPHRGKVRTQDAGVERARGEIVAFSDANATLATDALRRLVARFADPEVGYVCGQVRFHGDGGNQEGLYWRYEMAVRALESQLAGVTGGNGAVYATRRESYIIVDERMGHDLSFPFNMAKRGWRAVYEPGAHADEKMTPTTETEFQRKRRMASHTWPIVLAGGMLSPRGYRPAYAFEIVSHRVLRYSTPLFHAVALASNAALLRRHPVYRAAFAAQLGLLAAAAVDAGRPGRVARYYVLMTASQALGLWDYLRSGTAAGWEKAEGTR